MNRLPSVGDGDERPMTWFECMGDGEAMPTLPNKSKRHEANGHAGSYTPRHASGSPSAGSARKVGQRAEPVTPHTIYTATEIMAMMLPEPRCIVSGIITEGLNLLVSRPKLGKSWLALQMSIAIAAGQYALGGRTTCKGDVLYVALEDSYRRLQDRLRKLLGGKAPPARLELTNQWRPLDEGGTDEIVNWANGVERPQLVVIDTVERVRSPGTRRGNAYSDDYSYLAQVHNLLKETSIAAVLGLHHDRKADSLDPLDVVSGSIGMTAAVDTILLLKRERGKADGYLSVHSRDLDDQDYGLEWDARHCGWTLVGSGQELRMSTARREIYECVKKHPNSTLEELIQFLGKPEKKNNIKQFLCQLVKQHDLQNTDGRYHLPTNSANSLTGNGRTHTPTNSANRLTG